MNGGGRGRGAAGAEGGVVSGEGVPPPQKIFEILSQNGAFLCILQSAAVILGSENAWRRGSVGLEPDAADAGDWRMRAASDVTSDTPTPKHAACCNGCPVSV